MNDILMKVAGNLHIFCVKCSYITRGCESSRPPHLNSAETTLFQIAADIKNCVADPCYNSLLLVNVKPIVLSFLTF